MHPKSPKYKLTSHWMLSPIFVYIYFMFAVDSVDSAWEPQTDLISRWGKKALTPMIRRHQFQCFHFLFTGWFYGASSEVTIPCNHRQACEKGSQWKHCEQMNQWLSEKLKLNGHQNNRMKGFSVIRIVLNYPEYGPSMTIVVCPW